MSNIASRILEAVQGDSNAIVALASAVAKNDTAAVRDLLGSRGVSLSADEIDSVIKGAAEGNGAACTCTCTCT